MCIYGSKFVPNMFTGNKFVKNLYRLETVSITMVLPFSGEFTQPVKFVVYIMVLVFRKAKHAPGMATGPHSGN